MNPLREEVLFALAHQQLSQSDQARSAFAGAVATAERDLPKPDSGDLGSGPNNWIIADILRREAQALIGGQRAAAK
jgi:hypothetical protein